MLIKDDDAAELKLWIVKKLANLSSDADADVLADYTLALLRADTPDAQLRIDAIQNLEDFLKDNTASFVDDVFRAIESRSYSSEYVPPAAVPQPAYSIPASSAHTYPSHALGRGAQPAFQESRKRPFGEVQNANGADSHYSRGDRQIKQIRRGGRGRGDGAGLRGGRGGFQEPGFPFPGPMPQDPNQFPMRQSPMEHRNVPMAHEMPLPPNGIPRFDQTDPLGALMTLQGMGFPSMPGIPPPFMERCRDYETQGYCTRGDSCPYLHGNDRVVVPNQDEYDPKNALLVDSSSIPPPPNNQHGANGQRGFAASRGANAGRGDRGGFVSRRNNRAEFSHAGPNHDRSVTTIVVEQIPEERFDEQSVRDFFSEFGNIEEVTMQPYKRLALVKYDDYGAARGAYDSPKVIFDNRFVKVYWYKPGTLPTPPANTRPGAGSPSANTAEEQPFDREKFEKDAQAAQKKLEEKKAQMKEMEVKRQALEKQKEALAQKQAEEKKRLLQRLAAKGASADADVLMTESKAESANEADDSKASAHTKALRAKVAELEAEAKSLGLDSALSDGYTPRGRGRGRGRGSYRGWEGFAGRGSYDAYRGSPRGRGSSRGHGGGKYNLDNRTKKVGVSGVEFTNEKDEALRQHLLAIGEFEAIEPHPDHPTTQQIITFKDRPTAESFMFGSKDIPQVGKVELSWFNNNNNNNNNNNTPFPPVSSAFGGKLDAGNGGGGECDHVGERGLGVEDYDVAEEDDRWMVE